MKSKQKKEIAKILFLKMGLSQVEIAERLNTSKTQISRWVSSGNWKTLRSAGVASSEQIINRTYAQIVKIYDLVDNEDRVISSAESDQISKLMSGVKALNKGADLSSFIQAFEEFIKYLREQEPELSKTISDYQMDFLTMKAQELSKE